MDFGNKLKKLFENYRYFKCVQTTKTLKNTRIKLYNTLGLSVLLYWNETRTIKAKDARRITAAVMKHV
jgi:hypothetical protein